MVFAISKENCRYRGEGNRSIVIWLEKEGKVLRIQKEDASSQNSVSKDILLQDLKLHVDVVQNVMTPLLGQDLVSCPVIISLLPEDVKMINSIIDKYRPAHRCHKILKEDFTYGLLLPDFCTFQEPLSLNATEEPVICVEIKPKQGYMKVEGDDGDYSRLCHFCSMQCYKLKNKIVSERSSYCPMDLFSGCYKRMQHAVLALLQTPQNNIRIFKDRNLVYCDENMGDLNTILEDFFLSASSEM